jgi:Ca-activated chloride channel family protein
MKPLIRILWLAVVYGLLALAAPLTTAATPRLEIAGPSELRADEVFPLKSSAAHVSIHGTIARVKLRQTYGNTGSGPIEAVYVFPCSTRAAVHGMTVTANGRTIAARIRETTRARTEYETAKAERKTAALLEEKRANVFQMSVANLLPGDDVTVEVDWTETIPASDGTSEFVFPTVVGPRYSGGGEGAAANDWAANPHLKQGAHNPARLSLQVSLVTALPLAEATCPSHPVTVDFRSRNEALVTIDTRAGEDAANRDFILRWKLAGNRVDAGLLLHKGDNENHFLLQIEPPARVTAEHLPPRDYVMILDVSGSMSGFPLDTATGLLTELVSGLKPADTFNVLCFASGSGLFAEAPVAASKENLQAAIAFIRSQHAGGGTELTAAIKRSLALPGGEDRSRTLVVLTDGYVTADEETAALVRDHIGSANVFTFGIGSSVNRELIESLARAGQGEATVVTSRSEAAPAAAAFLTKISSPVLAKIKIEAEGMEINDMEPQRPGDLFAARPLVVSGVWKGDPRGRIVVRGIAGNGEAFVKAVDLTESAESGLDHPALPVLWARERVRSLQEKRVSAESVAAITALGLKHSLLTRHTSFVAVDETPREMLADARTVRQPLPLPQGVSESALSSAQSSPVVQGGSVPEPGAIGLISLLVVLLALQRRR